MNSNSNELFKNWIAIELMSRNRIFKVGVDGRIVARKDDSQTCKYTVYSFILSAFWASAITAFPVGVDHRVVERSEIASFIPLQS